MSQAACARQRAHPAQHLLEQHAEHERAFGVVQVGQDLYSDPLGALERLRATGDHPMNFYLNVGFSLVGVMPDAEGRGMPSIHFAMSVG